MESFGLLSSAFFRSATSWRSESRSLAMASSRALLSDGGGGVEDGDSPCCDRDRERPSATAEDMLRCCVPFACATLGDSGRSSSSTSSASRSVACAAGCYVRSCQSSDTHIVIRNVAPYSLLVLVFRIILIFGLRRWWNTIHFLRLFSFAGSIFLLVLLLFRLRYCAYLQVSQLSNWPRPHLRGSARPQKGHGSSKLTYRSGSRDLKLQAQTWRCGSESLLRMRNLEA